MNYSEFSRVMKEYQDEVIENFINGDNFDPGIVITYPTTTGVRSFCITNVQYSKVFPGCIEGTCMTNYPEGREAYTGIDEVDYGTSRRTFSIAKIIKIGDWET